jgi:hypothetical protein
MNVMNRIPSTAAAVLAVALVLTVVPAVQARTLDRHPSNPPAAGWLDATLAWLTSAVTGAAFGPIQGVQVKSTGIPIGSGGHGAMPMTGSCIDPNGASKPCGTPVGGGGI